MVKESIGIILEFGFHDLKKYIYSGLGQKIANTFNIVWLAIQKNSEEFDRLFSETGFPIVYFNQDDFIGSTKIEAHNAAVRRAWMNRKKLGQFHNYRTLRTGKPKSLILGNKLLRRFYEKKTLQVVESRYFNRKVEEIIHKHGINLLFSAGYSSSFSKSVFITGHRNNIPCHLLINNWKDLYINDFIPFRFLSSVFVWDEGMRSDYLLHMTYLKPESVIVSGNPVFDSLRLSQPTRNRQYYSQKYNLPESAQWIYYTMMSPLAGIDEIEIVKNICHELSKAFAKDERVILLRRNPQHMKEDFADEELPDNLVLTEHYSYFDRAKDMHTQSPEGEAEWIDLLHHCSLNLSVPSTVTLEFLTLNKPVINIGFGPDGLPDERLRQHFEAGFYKSMFENDLVMEVFRIEDLNKLINGARSQASSTNLDQKEIFPTELASDRIIRHILQD